MPRQSEKDERQSETQEKEDSGKKKEEADRLRRVFSPHHLLKTLFPTIAIICPYLCPSSHLLPHVSVYLSRGGFFISLTFIIDETSALTLKVFAVCVLLMTKELETLNLTWISHISKLITIMWEFIQSVYHHLNGGGIITSQQHNQTADRSLSHTTGDF